MNFAVLQFPGSNCDQDCVHVLQNVLGHPTRLLWHKETSLGDADAVFIPGGFSYGDYLRTGSIACFSPVMAAVKEFAADGGHVLGICNGFQILCEAGLLPGALIRNRSLQFRCEHVYLKVAAPESPFTNAVPEGQLLRISIAHGEGNYFCDEATLEIADNREVGARVRSVTPSLDPESRSATAVLSLARPIPGLQPGAFLQARIRPSGEVDTGRMSVPESAVQTIDGAEVVFVRTRRGFQTRRVVTGARSGGRVVIESGLEAQWRIATANAFLLKAELEKEEAEHGH